MASSSQNLFEESLDDTFDQCFDQYFDQTFENFTIGHQEEARKQRKKRAYIERNLEEGHIRLWNDYSVKLQRILKISSDDFLE